MSYAEDSWGAIKARDREADRVIVYQLPTEIVFGAGVLTQLGPRLTEMNLHSPLLVTDEGVRSAGIVDQVLSALAASNLDAPVFDRVQSDPTTETVEHIRDLLHQGNHDSVIGLGGGSPMDAAKAAGALATNPGSPLDYAGGDELEADPLPTIAIPTTAGTGSEVTMFSVLTDSDSGNKVSIGTTRIMPKLALLDPDLTVGLPPPMTATTGMDALSHAVESYGSVWNHPIAEGLALRAIELVGQYLRRAVTKGTDREARGAMLMASLIAELAANSTRLGLAHAIGVPLGARHHIPHGLALALLLAPVADFNAAADPERYARIARALDSNSTNAAEAIEQLRQDVGIEDRLANWGVGEDDLPAIAELALGSDNVQANPRVAEHSELVTILKAAL